MFPALILAASFLHDFGGVWTCGNARYHERWQISAHSGAPAPSHMVDVVYGDPRSPDGFAYVYYVPGAHLWRYDDFHADGSQAHLQSGGSERGLWTWTGWYYPIRGAADRGPDITWQRIDGKIVRHFYQRAGGKTLPKGNDACR